MTEIISKLYLKYIFFNAERQKEKIIKKPLTENVSVFGLKSYPHKTLDKVLDSDIMEVMNKKTLYVKKWREKNPEKMKEYYIKEKKNIEKSLFGRAKKVILSRDNFQCQLCGAKEKLEIHHIDGNGASKNGKRLKTKEKNNNLDNLITLCYRCHRQIDSWKIKKKDWSRKFKKCIVCGTTERKYSCNGMCSSCYEKTRREYKKLYWQKNYQK